MIEIEYECVKCKESNKVELGYPSSDERFLEAGHDTRILQERLDCENCSSSYDLNLQFGGGELEDSSFKSSSGKSAEFYIEYSESEYTKQEELQAKADGFAELAEEFYNSKK